MKTEALGDKLTKRLAEVKVETLVTLLSEIKADALMDTLADRLTAVEIETLGEKSGSNRRRGAYQQIGLRAKKGEF